MMKNKTISLTVGNTMGMIRISTIAMIMIFLTSIAYSQNTVVDIVVNSENHTTLEAAVVASELADDLSGEGPFTVFAPTDEAFKALPEGTVEVLLQDPTGELAEILLYHVAGTTALSSDLADGQQIETLNGDVVDVKIQDGKAYINEAMVIVADIEADNGVVHVIDAVILPSAEMADAGNKASGQGCAN